MQKIQSRQKIPSSKLQENKPESTQKKSKSPSQSRTNAIKSIDNRQTSMQQQNKQRNRIHTMNQTTPKFSQNNTQNKTFHQQKQSMHISHQFPNRITIENQKLKNTMQTFLLQNIQLKQQNQNLKYQVKSLLTELQILLIHTDSSYKKQPDTNNFQNNNQMNKNKSSQLLMTNHNYNNNNNCYSNYNSQNTTVNQHSQLKVLLSKYQILIRNLQNQNQLLHTITSNLSSQLQMMRQSNSIQQETIYNIKNTSKEHVNKQLQMEEQLRSLSSKIIKLEKVLEEKEQQYQRMHNKFHLELEKCSYKNQKYKLKLEQCKEQRDEFAMQIYKAKMEIGGEIGTRKYFPAFQL